MAKGNTKSSATSGTRKKHAKRAAGPAQVADDSGPIQKEKKATKKERGQKKNVKEPRVKVYIPPVKPAPVQPDPLETTGLMHKLPPELLIVLRNLSKRAQVTKVRALEELQAGWVEKCIGEGEDGVVVYVLVDMLPVWLHHVSALFLHHSRRVRLLTAGIHASLLQIPTIRDQILLSLSEMASASQLEAILGTWCMAAHDIDRLVASTALKSWTSTISIIHNSNDLSLNDHLLSPLGTFTQRAILDPGAVHAYLNPAQPPAVSTPSQKKGSNGLRREDRGEFDQVVRAKAEDMEENEEDRRARLRVGAFGALRWISETSTAISSDMLNFLKNPLLWSSLHHAAQYPSANSWDGESFGFAQPGVRKAAWALVGTLLKTSKGLKEHLESIVPVLSMAILTSAWVESDATVQAVMWEPLLLFLKEFPNAWELDRTLDSNADETQGDESDEDGDGSDMEDDVKKSLSEGVNITRPSRAYQEFLGFLESGCAGAPLQGYPAVVVFVSTIPSSILSSLPPLPMEATMSTSTTYTSTPLTHLFNAFWKVLDTRVLSGLPTHRSATSAAFLSALLECLVFLVKRVRGGKGHAVLVLRPDVVEEGRRGEVQKEEPGMKPAVHDGVRNLVQEQMGKVWNALAASSKTVGLRVEQRAAARLVGQTLVALYEVDKDLFGAAWDTLALAISCSTETSPGLVAVFLKAFQVRFKHMEGPRETVAALTAEVLVAAGRDCAASLTRKLGEIDSKEGEEQVDHLEKRDKGGISLLVHMFEQFREGLFDDVEFSRQLDETVVEYGFLLLTVSPSLLLAYLIHRKHEAQCGRVWHVLLTGMAEHPDKAEHAIQPLLDAAQGAVLHSYLRPSTVGLDALVGGLLEVALTSDAKRLAFVKQVLEVPDYFLSESGYSEMIDRVIASFTLQVYLALSDLEAEVSLGTFGPVLEVITALVQHPPRILPPKDFDGLVPDMFVLAYLLPEFDPSSKDHATVGRAKELWGEWLKTVLPGDKKDGVLAKIKTKLQVLLCDTQVRPLPQDILRMLSQTAPDLNIQLLADVFPTPTEINQMLYQLSPDPIDASLAVMDPLIPPASAFTGESTLMQPQQYDTRGFSSYARVVDALLHFFAEDRQSAKQNTWALRHFLAFEVYAQDFMNVPSAQSPVFEQKALATGLEDTILKMRQMSTYVLTSVADNGWRGAALGAVLEDKPAGEIGALATLLVDAIRLARERDLMRDVRILRIILDHVFHDMERDEADRWMLLARKIELTAPETSMAIVSAATKYALEPPRLDRYRNELAAALLGIPPRKANTDGLLTLRKLATSAPGSESDVEFLPQPRAVKVMKACQQWIASDEDIDEDLESVMTLVFIHLAPILQDVPGAHWDLVFDVVENNMENASITDDEMLVVLARTLRLVILIEDLASTNKSLRAGWQNRKMPILMVIRDLATVSLDGVAPSVPRSTCRGLILTIVQHLPVSLIDHETLPKMCHLVLDSSIDVQKMAYQFLQGAAKKHTEHLVIEAGVDTESTVSIDLPAEILDILQRTINYGETAVLEGQNAFGHLLGWMLLFDLFQDASLKVRSRYIEQLRNLDIIATHFIPNSIHFLQLDQGPLKVFKLDIWAVNEFHVEFYEEHSAFSLPILAAHLYYRALLTVPSLIHTWVLDCKDRQLSSTITNYTSQYFSPVIIQAELTHVKSPESTALLVDSNLTIKVASSVGEVVASYLVDDHQLEIKLKIPSDWPLHKIEIKDLKRVGVDENRWRAWILAVQQIIWSHNGRIVDGLGLFKKNVTLHFEGQVDCAICYSIISVMDGSLPRKPCRTCKNRFHAGCLYKWFNTSHSSSCPLCRSDII